MDNLKNNLEEEIKETATLESSEKLIVSTIEKLNASISELTEDLYLAYLEEKWKHKDSETNINPVAETAQIVEEIGDNPKLLGEVVSMLTKKQMQLLSELNQLKGQLTE
ncbi:hypothetical protein LSAT2_001316 [Lamellibrachia satsuma]|nr:hypothetical protein LSAT2_001316 [Lamellibrachia satsuma]